MSSWAEPRSLVLELSISQIAVMRKEEPRVMIPHINCHILGIIDTPDFKSVVSECSVLSLFL